MLKILFFLLFLCVFSVSAAGPMEYLRDPRTGNAARYAGTLSPRGAYATVPKNFSSPKYGFRGVWVATVENIDFGKVSSEREFKMAYLAMLSNLRRIGCGAVFFQVRPANDAFYRSKLNPMSAYLTGKQGRTFGYFDPMLFMVEEAHKRGIEFHAWLNPYRVSVAVPLSKKEFLRTLAPGNFAARNPDLLLAVPNGSGRNLMILDPGSPRTVRFLIDTVNEIIRNYRVDGIHMDDYFYPYEGIGNADRVSFSRYNPRGMGLDDWRRHNTDLLVYNVSKNIREFNRKTGRRVRFGISPFGIWANRSTFRTGSPTKGSESYKIQHADTRKWVKNRWVDYIVPQLYWTFGHNKAAYAALADWWADTVRGTGVSLYIGHAPARLGTTVEWSNPDEIFNQFRFNSTRPEIAGSVLFSYRSIFTPSNRVMRTGSAKAVRAWHETAYRR